MDGETAQKLRSHNHTSIMGSTLPASSSLRYCSSAQLGNGGTEVVGNGIQHMYHQPIYTTHSLRRARNGGRIPSPPRSPSPPPPPPPRYPGQYPTLPINGDATSACQHHYQTIRYGETTTREKNAKHQSATLGRDKNGRSSQNNHNHSSTSNNNNNNHASTTQRRQMEQLSAASHQQRQEELELYRNTRDAKNDYHA